MNEVVPLQVKPKKESHVWQGQRYVLQFEPLAPPELRWSWMVSFTKTYTYFGGAATLPLASRGAKTKINRLLFREEREDAG